MIEVVPLSYNVDYSLSQPKLMKFYAFWFSGLAQLWFALGNFLDFNFNYFVIIDLLIFLKFIS